jgi:hypothetical protein
MEADSLTATVATHAVELFRNYTPQGGKYSNVAQQNVSRKISQVDQGTAVHEQNQIEGFDVFQIMGCNS